MVTIALVSLGGVGGGGVGDQSLVANFVSKKLEMIHAAVNRSCKDHYHLLLSVEFHTSGWFNVLSLIHHHLICQLDNFMMLFICATIAHYS